MNYVRLHGLGRDYLNTYVQKVYKVTPAEVRRIAGEYVRGQDMAIYIVGDFAKIKDQVAPYGEVVKEEIK